MLVRLIQACGSNFKSFVDHAIIITNSREHFQFPNNVPSKMFGNVTYATRNKNRTQS